MYSKMFIVNENFLCKSLTDFESMWFFVFEKKKLYTILIN